MSLVASFELCKTLHELSDWVDESVDCFVHSDGVISYNGNYNDAIREALPGKVVAPCYSLGYLLRKLPVDYQLEDHKNQNDKKELGYSNYHMVAFNPKVGVDFLAVDADTPEDAACKLAIELFKQGILERTK